MPVTHLFVSALPDGADATVVRPSNWNEAHVVSIDNSDVDPAAGIVESKLSLNFPTHASVTIGTANGLSLVTQTLSLGLASSGVTGALSGTDWDTFNGKQAALTFPLSPTLGGTGVNNGTNALTVPATMTAAGQNYANVFTVANVFQGGISAPNTSFLESEAFGLGASVGANQCLSVGTNATCGTFTNALAMGTDASATAQFTTAIGRGSQASSTRASAVGYLSIASGGNSFALGAEAEATASNSIAIGYNANSNHASSIVFGRASTSTKANQLVIGDTSATVTEVIFPGGLANFNKTTTTTNAVLEIARLTAEVSTASTGGANGFGVGFSFYTETATHNTFQQQGLISTSWVDATNASRKAKMSLSAYDTAARLGIEIEASGTAPMLGLYGVAPVARATNAIVAAAFVANTSGIANDTATFGGYTLGQIAQALINIGILT